MAGGTKEKGASTSPSFLPFFWAWRQETLGFLAPGAWRMTRERGRRERERLGRKSPVFSWLNQTYTVHVYINTGSSDPNPKLP